MEHHHGSGNELFFFIISFDEMEDVFRDESFRVCSSYNAVDSRTSPISPTPPITRQTQTSILNSAAMQPSPYFHAAESTQKDRYDGQSSVAGFVFATLSENRCDSLFLFFLEMIDGCFVKLVALIEENAVIIAGVAIGIAALEVRRACSRNILAKPTIERVPPR